MQRTVSAHLDITIEDPTDITFILAVAAAADPGSQQVDESLVVLHNGAELEVTEVPDAHGTRMHCVRAPLGQLTLDYQAAVSGSAVPETVNPADAIRYGRPSRYCHSDTLAPTAAYEFQGLRGYEAITAVEAWVYDQLEYVPGSSGPTDGAAETLLGRQGVCRDYAHLVVALLRSLDVPARLAAVYAPGLEPMDFHAVVEAYADGTWYLVDATRLAPRQSLLRIATGRDAADTAFMTAGPGAILDSVEVTAVADKLPEDTDRAKRVQLA